MRHSRMRRECRRLPPSNLTEPLARAGTSLQRSPASSALYRHPQTVPADSPTLMGRAAESGRGGRTNEWGYRRGACAFPAAVAGVGDRGIGIGVLRLGGGSVASGIAYSGTLRNNGVLDGSPHDFTFDLVDGAGNTVGCPQDARIALTVANGRFDVADLFASCAGLDALLAAQPSVAVRIAVDGHVLAPNQPWAACPTPAWPRRSRRSTTSRSHRRGRRRPTPPTARCTSTGGALYLYFNGGWVQVFNTGNGSINTGLGSSSGNAGASCSAIHAACPTCQSAQYWLTRVRRSRRGAR